MTEAIKALVKFQTEFGGVKADGTNPHFRSDYITLDGILETAKPILARHGLALLQDVYGNMECITVKTKLLHESGEALESGELQGKPAKNDPQAMGSLITYLKRYQVAAFLGVCESDDDDGNAAAGNPNPPDPNKLTHEQQDQLRAAIKMAGHETKEAYEKLCKSVLGVVKPVPALSPDEATKIRGVLPRSDLK